MTPAQSASGNATQHKVKIRSQVIIDTLNALGYSFRFNELTQAVEVNGTAITDGVAAKIRNDMRDMDFKGMGAVEDAYLAHAVERSYHPIRDYFNSLKWNGLGHIEQLATCFTDSGPVDAAGRSWFYRAVRRWLIGYVARIYAHAQLPMLVLEGTQRKGKSFFAAWLASILPDYFIEGPIMPDNKDCLLRLGTSFIWEVSELGATVRRADTEALKGFITLNNITVRKPYGKHDLHLPATAGLIGTVNDSGGFLNDSTGTRRALVIPLVDINWGYSTSVDVVQLWAEAVAAYQAGESATLTDEERETQAEINTIYETPNSVEDLLPVHFDIDPGKIPQAQADYQITRLKPDWFTLSNDIREVVDLQLKGTSQQHTLAVASALKKLGAVRDKLYISGKQVRGYYGIRTKVP